MNKIFAIVCLALGAVILVWGHNISQSVNSQVKELFTGSPTDKAVYYYVVGGVLVAVGAFQLVRSGKK